MDQVSSHLEFIWLAKLCSRVDYPKWFHFGPSGYFGLFLSNGWAKISEIVLLKHRLLIFHVNPISLDLDWKQESYDPMNLTLPKCQHVEV